MDAGQLLCASSWVFGEFRVVYGWCVFCFAMGTERSTRWEEMSPDAVFLSSGVKPCKKKVPSRHGGRWKGRQGQASGLWQGFSAPLPSMLFWVWLPLSLPLSWLRPPLTHFLRFSKHSSSWCSHPCLCCTEEPCPHLTLSLEESI